MAESIVKDCTFLPMGNRPVPWGSFHLRAVPPEAGSRIAWSFLRGWAPFEHLTWTRTTMVVGVVEVAIMIGRYIVVAGVKPSHRRQGSSFALYLADRSRCPEQQIDGFADQVGHRRVSAGS